MSEHKHSQVCHCENCGNESEMVITCQLEAIPEKAKSKETDKTALEKKRVLGQAVCKNCGNEADMWVDLPKEA